MNTKDSEISLRWSFRCNWWKYLILFIYFLSVFYVAVKHEPWFDEAQAWLLARDVGIFDLFINHLRYEGTPGLWHFLLMLPSKMHLPYYSAEVISVLFGLLGVVLVLFYSPFPKWIKILYPFTYFALYQYAVVSRSYVLIPFLLFTIAAVYKKRTQQIYLFTFLNILLANVCVPCTIIAICLMFVYFIEFLWNKSNLDKNLLRDHYILFSIFTLSIISIIFQLWPPSDLSFMTNATSGVFILSFSEIAKKSLEIIRLSMIETLKLSLLVYFISIIWFYHRKVLSYFLLPFISLTLFFSIVYFNSWHQGIYFFLWLFALWLSFEKKPNSISSKETTKAISKTPFWRFTGYTMLAVIGIVFCFQVFWGFSAALRDINQTYCPARAVAEYIKENNIDKTKIAGIGFSSFAVLPYFDHNIYANHIIDSQDQSFWLWKKGKDGHGMNFFPEYILVGCKNDCPDNVVKIDKYAEIAKFRGGIIWKNGVLENDSYVLLKKISE